MASKENRVTSGAKQTRSKSQTGARKTFKGTARSGITKDRRRAGPTAQPSRLADVHVQVPEVGQVAVLQAKAANVVQHLGGPTNVARILDVSKSQPGRWVRGTETPSARSTKLIVDLDYALSRLEQLYEPETAAAWMDSPNSFLAGARPIDVLLAEGPADVIGAIDASLAGSFA